MHYSFLNSISILGIDSKNITGSAYASGDNEKYSEDRVYRCTPCTDLLQTSGEKLNSKQPQNYSNVSCYQWKRQYKN